MKVSTYKSSTKHNSSNLFHDDSVKWAIQYSVAALVFKNTHTTCTLQTGMGSTSVPPVCRSVGQWQEHGGGAQAAVGPDSM